VSYLEVAPNYASVILGIGNTFGSLPGIISPILTGYIVTNEHGTKDWKVVFCTAAGIYLLWVHHLRSVCFCRTTTVGY
ncbi:hypothetical protein NQ317_009607, partial [Molorchus minor]